MRSVAFGVAALLLASAATARATTFTFDTDPFAGSTALTTPGRQIVAGELFITFVPGSDRFVFDPAAFALNLTDPFIPPVVFASDVAANLPTSGANFIVLREFPVPLGAGGAADLIAARVTTPGAGFFIYFNSGLESRAARVLDRPQRRVGRPEGPRAHHEPGWPGWTRCVRGLHGC